MRTEKINKLKVKFNMGCSLNKINLLWKSERRVLK
jgi:hypothetical protein